MSAPDTLRRRRRLTIIIALVLLVCAGVLFTTWELPDGARDYALNRRLQTLVSLITVGISVGVATVAFQTITANKILTPSFMGFDSLYILIQTVVLFFLGSQFFTETDPRILFAITTIIMMGFSAILFGSVFAGGRTSLDLLLLIGIVFGVLFTSGSALIQRIIDPGEYQILADKFFANFSFVHPQLLLPAGIVTAVCCGVLWWRRHQLDVMLLGRDTATGLGVNYRFEVILTLVCCSVLVSVSTALVGPIAFFGLIVGNLAYQILGGDRHAFTLPLSGLFGALFLVAGQWALQRIFTYTTALSVIIEFAGGLLFLYLLLNKKGLAR